MEKYEDEVLMETPQEKQKSQEAAYYRTEVTVTAKNVEYMSDEAQQRFEVLGLEKVFFKIHSREALSYDQTKEKLKDPHVNVYVLLHGWTGTNEIYDHVHKANGLTIVEQILQGDPNAVIISPDGLGCGQTEFKPMSAQEKIDKCGPSEYADEIEFILANLLEIKNRKRVFVEAHSWSGAAEILMCAKGYVLPENCVAVSPALLPRENPTSPEIPFKMPSDDYFRVRETYRLLANVANAGLQIAEASETGRKAKDLVIKSELVNIAMQYFMGKSKPGSIEYDEMRRIYGELKSIHQNQIAENLDTAYAVMYALARGTNFTHLKSFGNEVNTPEEISNLNRITIYAATEDKLAPVTAAYANTMKQPENIGYENTEWEGLRLVSGSGHYALLYAQGEFDPTNTLLQKAKTQYESNSSKDNHENVKIPDHYFV